MAMLTRRSVLRGSMGLAAALARPHVANTAAMTAELWWVQGYVPRNTTRASTAFTP